MNPQSDCTTPTKKQTKALQQAQRRANPVTRRLEQSSVVVVVRRPSVPIEFLRKFISVCIVNNISTFY